MSTWWKRVGAQVWCNAKRSTLTAGLLTAVVVGSTGCGALGALTNPKATWALDESAPMGVVVRRAEIANATAKQVERLMGRSGVDNTSAWVPRTSIKKEDAEALLASIAANDDIYKAAQAAKVRVVPAEAWYANFSGLCSSEDDHPNLLAATSPALGTAFDEIAKLQDELAKLNGKVAAEEVELDKDGISDADKATREKKIEELEAAIDKVEESFDPKFEAFILKVREEAGKADDATKKRVGVAVVNLRRAVEDAKLNNAVAMLRYPMALPGLADDVQSAAKRIIADIIEEKTGKRPDMSTLKPEVALQGIDVKLTLNGLSASEIADMSPEEVIEETTLRLGAYVGRVASLVAYVDETQQLLNFQGKVLDAWVEGLKIDPANLIGGGDDLGELAVMTGSPSTKKLNPSAFAAEGRSLGKHTASGLRTASCKAQPKSEVTTAAASEPEPAKTTGPKGKTGGPIAAKAKSTGSSGQTTPAMSEVPKSTKSSGGENAASKPSKPCDVVVTNAEGSFCL
jgi:hypothetical protein